MEIETRRAVENRIFRYFEYWRQRSNSEFNICVGWEERHNTRNGRYTGRYCLGPLQCIISVAHLPVVGGSTVCPSSCVLGHRLVRGG
jgi:hypothetical protein